MVLLFERTDFPQDWFRDPAAVRKCGERPVATEFSKRFKVHVRDVGYAPGA